MRYFKASGNNKDILSHIICAKCSDDDTHNVYNYTLYVYDSNGNIKYYPYIYKYGSLGNMSYSEITKNELEQELFLYEL